MKTESWKGIEDFPAYEVSNLGRVRSNAQDKNKYVLSPEKMKVGYFRVCLCKNGNRHKKRIHRLVAKAFIPNPLQKPQVNHIDGVKDNNCVSNLEWCTPLENYKHAFEMGLMPKPKGMAINFCKLTSAIVMDIRKKHETGKYTYKQIGEMYNISGANIHYIVKRKTWKAV